MSAVAVRRISAEETIAVRWPILRPGFPRETAIFPGDEVDSTIHLGGYVDGRLVGVASIYIAAMPGHPEVTAAWQLRGMATLPEVRGAGVGRALLTACEDAARGVAGAFLWCNARVTAAEFYRKHGWCVIGDEFDIPTVGPHYRMRRELR